MCSQPVQRKLGTVLPWSALWGHLATTAESKFGRKYNMMKWVLAAGIVLAMPVAASAQDAEAGAGVFKKCGACHQIGPNAKNALGPVLTCVDGRKAGTYEGFAGYSEALKSSGITWDDATLLKWFENDD